MFIAKLDIETFFYEGTLYTWHHEPQNLYQRRHIRLYDCVLAINDCREPVPQDWYDPPLWKYIGKSIAGIITVITEEDETHIITARHASTEEIKTWLRDNIHCFSLQTREKQKYGQRCTLGSQ